ncbi:MAG: rubrerythrin family protein [Armatimonadetes bacterium]|nr:rubrerythrin family protein [Armatimonadota bacterium]
MASLKGSQTEKNVLAAFAGESQARNRYTYAASVARDEGFMQISEIFLETADNEKEHAKVFFKYLEGGEVEITAGYPAGVIGDTLANLRAAAAGEKAEWSTLYPTFAQTAKDEGFTAICNSFSQIAEVESAHERRYNILAARVEAGEVFKRAAAIKWKCRNCGRVMEGVEAPKMCPACQHPQAFYEPFAENY